MATFTDDWDTNRSSDDTNATEIDDYINNLATDVEERLKNWVYGFVAGENDGIGGLIYGKFKVQTAAPTQIANTILLYGLDVSDKCELHFIDEDGDARQVTEGGYLLIGSGTTSRAMMHNSTEEDTENGRESQIRAQGEQSGGEVSTLGLIEISHDGASDDQKGRIRFLLNDGDDDDAPSKCALVLQNDGKIDVTDSLSVLDEDDMASDDAECVPTQQSVKAYVDNITLVNGVATRVYTKYLTGTLDADTGTNVAHGVTAANILSVSAICYDDNLSGYRVSEHLIVSAGTNAEFSVHYDATNVVIGSVGSNLQGNAYRIRIDYTA